MWKLKAIPEHHRMKRSWIVITRSHSPFILWKILLDVGRLVAVTAASLSHRNCTDRILVVPARYIVPNTPTLATSPQSYDWYDVISD
jgi:hypothetical protein